MAVAVLIEGVVIALLGLLVVGLLRSHAEILHKLRQLEEGAGTATVAPAVGGVGGVAPVRPAAARPAFDVMGTSLSDEVVKVGVAGARNDTLLAFLTSGCFTCIGFWDTFRASRRLDVPGGARLVVVTKDPAEESPSRLAELAPRDHTVVMSSAAWEQYGVAVAPYFVYVDGEAGAVIAGGGASDWDQVTDLWSKAVAKSRRNTGRARHERADAELARAGIRPGDPSLYPPKEG